MPIPDAEEFINIIAGGNTGGAEALFSKAGGRSYLESTVVMMISALPVVEDEKEDLFVLFIKALDKLERRIKRQKDGQKILKQVYG